MALTLPRSLGDAAGEGAPDEEGALLERLRAGESRAVGESYDEHHQALRTFAHRLTGDAAAAEDLVQETFLALPRAVRGFRRESALRTFLFGIAANLARKHVRTSVRRRRMAERYAERPTGDADRPDELAERQQLADVLSRALDELPLAQRIAFVLCEVEQRTSVEAAEILAVPQETVRTRVFHARKKLRALLEKAGVR